MVRAAGGCRSGPAFPSADGPMPERAGGRAFPLVRASISQDGHRAGRPRRVSAAQPGADRCDSGRRRSSGRGAERSSGSTSPPRPPLSSPRRRDASRRSRPYTAITAGAGGLPFRGWAVPRGAGRRRRALRRRRLGRAVCGVAGIGTSGGGGVGGAAAGGGYVPKGRAARLRGGVAHSGGGGGGLGGGVGRRGRGRPGV